LSDWLPQLSWIDLVDIAVVAGFAWLLIRLFRRTRGRAALAGLALLGVVYFVARELDLRLTAAIFQAFTAVMLIVFVVVFQEDLRRLFEQLGTWRRGASAPPAKTEFVDQLVRAVARMASMRTGALFVLPGKEPLDRHIEGGIPLGGKISEPLLLSLFDASSPGHDGAVIVRGAKIERFAVHLPLSANQAALGPGGTRHAAALGLSERCDAVCVVVSEERGTISVARDGAIRTLAGARDLAGELRSVLQTEPDPRPWWRTRVWLDAALAFALALLLWMALIPGSDMDEATFDATIEVTNLPNDLVLESIAPPTVQVTLQGLSRDLLLSEAGEVSVRVDAYLARLGRRTFTITAQDVQKPPGLSVVSTEPSKVRLSLGSANPPKTADGP
jgi:diadenylate cyclase